MTKHIEHSRCSKGLEAPLGLAVPSLRGKGVWHYIDLHAMAAATGVAPARPYFIAADATPSPGGLPIGGTADALLPNNHLEYAITWYALAVALLAVYIVFHLKRRV